MEYRHALKRRYAQIGGALEHFMSLLFLLKMSIEMRGQR